MHETIVANECKRRFLRVCLSGPQCSAIVPTSLYGAVYRCGLRHRSARPNALVGHEEEGLVLPDRSAKGAAKLVLVKYRCETAEEVVRVQECIAIKVEGIPVEAVGAVLDQRVHHA